MKKIISLLVMVTLCVSLGACGKTANDTVTKEEKTQTNTQAETEAETQAETETGTQAETQAETPAAEENSQTAESVTAAEISTEMSTESGSKTLVVYFSATGTTRAIAESIADGLQADIYEIIPEEPYTEADLNYNDNNSRSTLEMNDSSARPGISGTIENFDQYDTVFLGAPVIKMYPIDWTD